MSTLHSSFALPLNPKKRNGNSKNDIGLKVWTTHSLEDTALSSRLFLFLDPIVLTTQAMV